MYTEYIYVPTPDTHENKWQFYQRQSGWISCLLFVVNLTLLTFYAVIPVLSLRLLWAGVTIVATLGILSAMFSIIFGKIWLDKIYGACGMAGNVGLPLWLLLSL